MRREHGDGAALALEARRSEPPAPHRRRPNWHRRPDVGLLLVVAAFAASRLAFYLAGVRIVTSAVAAGGFYQVLDTRFLHRHLAQSLLYLHSQPPLYNLEIALYTFPNTAGRTVAMVGVDLLLGLVLVCSSYGLARQLGVGRRLSALVGVLLCASPTVVLYEDFEFYTYRTAALLTLSAYLLVRFLARRSIASGVGFFSAVAALVLYNSSFQWPFLLGAGAVALVAARSQWRRVLACAAVPLAVVAAWYAKDAVIFHTDETSSWLGMNLARTTLITAPPGEVQRLVNAGRLTSLALLPPFMEASAYEPTYVRRDITGIPVLDELEKAHHIGPNLNNKAIISVSAQYLHDDLAFIRADPSSYLSSVASAVRLFFAPPEQYYFLDANRRAISAYAAGFDRFVLGQPQFFPAFAHEPTILPGAAPGPAQLSYSALLAFALTLFGAPALARSRRLAPAVRAGYAYILGASCYVFVVTALVEYGENQRFRFDLGPLPLVCAVAVTCELVALIRRRFARRAGAGAPS